MTELEDEIADKYGDILGIRKKKKPGEPHNGFYSIYSSGLDELLGEKFKNKGDDDPFPERKRRIEQIGLSDLGESVIYLSKYMFEDKPEDKSRNFDSVIIPKYNEINNVGDKFEKIYNSNLENYIIFEKNNSNILKNYIHKIPSTLTNNFSNIQTSPLGLNLYLKDETTSINADNIGEFALPIVEYIHQTQPDYVIASDRGARLLGLAVFKLHRLIYGRFPTADGTIKFRRFSKSNSQEDTQNHLQPLVKDMLENKQRPTVLVLDDWVCSGGTKRIAEETFDRLSNGRIKTKFGVLIGGGADISGDGFHTSGFASVTDWRDDSNIIGVMYGSDKQGNSGTKGRPVYSEEARAYRIRMYQGIQRFADKLLAKRRR